jgi:uncharacterized protein
MGSIFLNLNLPIEYSDNDIRSIIKKKLKINNFTFSIDLKSLDARQTKNIHWQLRILVNSEELKNDETEQAEKIEIPFRKRNLTIAVVGSGPAGFFAADTLLKAGFQVTVFERGASVEDRAIALREFEKDNIFSQEANYAYGEGGAGTFSDGKLTSRTKGISALKQYIIEQYIKAGAPDEIRFLSKPHIGSNNLRNVVMNLRKQFLHRGGEIHFRTAVNGFSQGKKIRLDTSSGVFECDIVVWATGHSAYDSFRMMIANGIQFLAKPFALGVRVEHEQKIINQAMWKKPEIKGLKSAEYILRWQGAESEAAYSFCMCPGGKVVQASPRQGLSIVNGMSNYQRNSPFANSAIVVPVSPDGLFRGEPSAGQMLDYIEAMEHEVWQIQNSFALPANRISSFLQGKVSGILPDTSYSHGVFSYDFRELFSASAMQQLRNGLTSFSQKIPGFEDGIMLGLESKTSCALQVLRNEQNGPCAGFENIYVTGEGSGFSGGIISSAVDGMKTAMHIVRMFP